MALKGGLSFEEPAGDSQQKRGMISSQRERGVDERIRLDQRTVEVDAEGREEGCVESGTGDGQRGSPSLGMRAITVQKMRCTATDVVFGRRTNETFIRPCTSLSIILMIPPKVTDSCFDTVPLQPGFIQSFLRAR